MSMNQARAILWAQWRSLRNFFPRRGIGWTAIVGVIWYGFWVAAAFAVMLLTSSTMSTSLAGVFLLVFLYWQVVPVLMAATGSLAGPAQAPGLSDSRDAIVRARSDAPRHGGIEVVLVLTGAGIGILRNPTLRPVERSGLAPVRGIQSGAGRGTARYYRPHSGAPAHPRGGFLSSDPVRRAAAAPVHPGPRIPGPAARLYDARIVARLALDGDRGFSARTRDSSGPWRSWSRGWPPRGCSATGSSAAPSPSMPRPRPRGRPADPRAGFVDQWSNDSSGCRPCCWAIRWARWSKKKCAF